MTRARRTTNEKVEKASVGLNEVGYSGNSLFNGVSTEEMYKELNHPYSLATYKKMSYHPSVNTPLSMYNSMVSKIKFRVVPVEDATKKEIKQAELVESMLDDMEVPMHDVLNDIMTMNTYGFSVLEKVYRRREKKSGSLHNDGVIGIRKLALRSQDSIEKFKFDASGNYVTHVVQDMSRVHDPYNRYRDRLINKVEIPRSKFMLFNLGRNRSNPYGTSPLRDIYLPWKYLTSIEELEAAGVAKDLQGVPVMYIPAQYMSGDASPEQKIIFEQFKNIVRNLQNNSQSGVILPSAVDPETRQPLFKLELLSTQGGKKNYDTTQVKEYYRAMIFIGMNADILLMGNTQTGSFALGSLKTSMTGAYVESMLKRVVQVLNDDLIRQIYELNGWDASRRCKIDYEGFSDIDLESFSKAVQRMAAVSMLPRTPEVVNQILKQIGLDDLPDNADIDSLFPQEVMAKEQMQQDQENTDATLAAKTSAGTSKAGQGMKQGMPGGTGKATGSSGDASANNSDNSA